MKCSRQVVAEHRPCPRAEVVSVPIKFALVAEEEPVSRESLNPSEPLEPDSQAQALTAPVLEVSREPSPDPVRELSRELSRRPRAAV
jgi:hypothetical protein